MVSLRKGVESLGSLLRNVAHGRAVCIETQGDPSLGIKGE
jgi:hypothetical protein